MVVCVVLPPMPEFLSSRKVELQLEVGIQVQGSQYKYFKPWGVVQSKYHCTMSALCSNELSLAVQGKVHISTARQEIFGHSCCCTLATYSTRTVWDVFQRLYNVADKDLSPKPLY